MFDVSILKKISHDLLSEEEISFGYELQVNQNAVGLTWQNQYTAHEDINNNELQKELAKEVTPIGDTEKISINGHLDNIAEEYFPEQGQLKHNIILQNIPGNIEGGEYFVYGGEFILSPESELYIDEEKQNSVFSTYNDLEIRSSERKERFYIMGSYAYDQKYIENNDEGVFPLTTRYEMQGDKLLIKVLVPISWLRAEERVYPVVIDPTIASYRTYGLYTIGDNGISSTSTSSVKLGWTSINGIMDEKYRTLLKFDIDDIPGDATIESASLKLQKESTITDDYSSGFTDYIDTKVYRINVYWSTNSARWTDINGNYSNASSTERVSSNVTYSFDLTSTIQGWHNNTYLNYGLLVKPISGGYRHFAHTYRNQSSSAYRPRLIISYTEANENPNPPAGINGNNTCVVNQYCTYQVQGDDPDTNDKLKFKIDYQDGETNWTSSYVDENTWSQSLSIKWTTTGGKELRAKAIDDGGATSDWSDKYLKTVTVIDDNTPPSPPSDITGPYTCPLNEYCSYRIRGYDPDPNDQLKFRIDYEDGTTGWTSSYVGEGVDSPALSIRWTTPGSKSLRAQAMDDDGAISDWSGTEHTVDVEDTNEPPVADTGATDPGPYQLPDGQSAMLISVNGGWSSDPDGSIANYDWICQSSNGLSCSLLNKKTAISSISLQAGTYNYELEVADDKGAKSTPANSPNRNVTITVIEHIDQPPVADTSATAQGPYFGQPEGVVLDGSESYDPDGDIVEYTWTCVSGNCSNPGVTTSAQKSVDLCPGTYTYKLQVTDDDSLVSNDQNSINNQVTIIVNESTQKPDIEASPNSLSFELRNAASPPSPSAIEGDAAWSNYQDKVEGRIHPGGYYVVGTENDMHLIKINGYTLMQSPGDPQLLYKTYTVAVPPDTDLDSIQLEITNINALEIPGDYDISPASPYYIWDEDKDEYVKAWGDGKDIADNKNMNIYGTNEYYPVRVAEMATGQMSRWKFAKVMFYPIQYNPVTKKVKYIDTADIRITFSEDQTPSEIDLLFRGDRTNDEEAQKRIDNYDAVADEWYAMGVMEAPGDDTYDYVIITTNAIKNGSAKLDEFIEHKKDMVFNPLVITEDDYGSLTGQAPNGTAEKIREWLKRNKPVMGIEYALFIGNPDPDDPIDSDDFVGDVPMKMCWPNNEGVPSDYFYADLTGNWDMDGDGLFGEDADRVAKGFDLEVEIYVGRIPVYNNNYPALDSILSKIIAYETDEGDISWRKKALLPIKPLHPDGQDENYKRGEKIKEDVLIPAGFDYFRIYEEDYDLNPPPEMTPTTMQNVEDEWGNGYGLVVWNTHGSSRRAVSIFESSRAPNLDDSKPSFTFQDSCHTGKPEISDNLGFSLLKYGAVSTVSASRSIQSNKSMGYYYAQNIVKKNLPCGKALYLIIEDNSFNDWISERNFLAFNLYGDPSVSLLKRDRDTFKINNTGDAMLSVEEIRKSKSWITVLAQPNTSEPFLINAGGSKRVPVEVSAHSLKEGVYTDHLNIFSNDPDENPYPQGVDISFNVLPPIQAETTAPSIAKLSPAANEQDVKTDEDIRLNVRDFGSGVNYETISVQVDHQDMGGFVYVLKDGSVQNEYDVAVMDTDQGYKIEYNPANDFGYNQLIDVKVDGKDLVGNLMAQESYSFTVEDDPNPPPPPPPPPPSDPLVSFYEFNEFDGNTAIDSVNALNGEMRGGATRNVSGKEGKSLLLDGLDDYVYVYDNAVQSITGSELSFGAWVNPDTMSDGGWIMTKGTTACWTTQSYQMWLSSDNKVSARLQFSDNTEVTLTGETVLSAGEWYHIFVTYDGSEARIYVNGEEDKVVSASGNIQDSALGLFIGAWSFATDEQNPAPRKFFHGEIDSVRIYEQVMTAEEIIALYEGIVTPKSDPILHYTFNEGSGEIANDISGMGNHGTIVGAAWDQEGLSGSTLDFDGVDDYVNAGVRDNLQFGSEESFSIETWIKPEASGEYQHIAGDGYATHRLGLLNGKFDIRLGQNNLIVTGDTEIERNIWSHVVAVYDSATKTARLYVNGEEIKTGSNDSVSWPSGDRPFSVGNTIGEMYYFAGLMDELRVYNQVLEATEILIHYNAEKPVSNDPPPPPPAGNVGHWKFDEGLGIYANDTSDYNNTGVIQNATWNATGVVNSALEFNGTDSSVDMGVKNEHQFGSDNDFSIEAWINPESRPIYQHIAGDGYLTYRMGLWEGKLDLRVGLNNLIVTADDPLVLDTWSHVVATHESSTGTVRLYVDGQEVKTGSNPSVSWSSGGRPFTLGNTIGEFYYFNGGIDEVRVYNEVMDAGVINQHYVDEKPSAPPPPTVNKMAEWKYDENAGTLAGDSAGSNDGQIQGASWESAGVLNTALRFDGTDDYIDIGVQPTFQYSPDDSFTIETWVKPEAAPIYSHIAGDGYLTYRMGLWEGKPDLRLGLNNLIVTADNPLTLNAWSHVVSTYDRSTKTVKLYVNGAEVKSGNKADLMWTAGDRPFSIGNTIGEFYHFQGTIDETRVYDGVLDQATIEQHYIDENPQMGPPTPSLTVGDWKFDETSGGTAADSSEYGHEGTVHGAVFGVGKINNGLTFDGEDDYIDMGVESRLGFSSTDNFTIAMWLKPDAFTEYQHLAGDGFLTYRLGINNGNLDLRVGMNSLIVTADEPLQLNQWNFVTGVYDASTKTIKLYLNGVEIKSGTNGSLNWISDIRPFTIGQTIGEGYNYWGIMDEVGVYHEALSAEEVMTLFNQ